MAMQKYGHQVAPEKSKSKAKTYFVFCILVLWVAGAMVWSSGRIAKYFGYDELLGEPIFVTSSGYPVY